MIPLLLLQLWGRIVGNVSLPSLAAPALNLLPSCSVTTVLYTGLWLVPAVPQEQSISAPSLAVPVGAYGNNHCSSWSYFTFFPLPPCFSKALSKQHHPRNRKVPSPGDVPNIKGLPCTADRTFIPLPFHVQAL